MYLKFTIKLACLLVLAFLVGCGQQTPPTEEVEPAETHTSLPIEPTAVPTMVPAEEAAEPIDETPVDEMEEVSSGDVPEDECLNCHTDKQRLIDTAKPEEEVVSESSGEG